MKNKRGGCLGCLNGRYGTDEAIMAYEDLWLGVRKDIRLVKHLAVRQSTEVVLWKTLKTRPSLGVISSKIGRLNRT